MNLKARFLAVWYAIFPPMERRIQRYAVEKTGALAQAHASLDESGARLDRALSTLQRKALQGK